MLDKKHLLVALPLYRSERPRFEDKTGLIAHCLISFGIDIDASWRGVGLHTCGGIDSVTEQVKLIFFCANNAAIKSTRS